MKAQMIKKVFGLMMITAALTLTACGKNSGGGNRGIVGPDLSTCTNCTGSGYPLLQGVSFTADGYLDGRVDIIGQLANSYDRNDPKIILRHSGEAVILGNMRVLQDRHWYTCGALVGEYHLRPLQAGINNMGVLQGQKIEAVHVSSGFRILIAVRNSEVYNTDGGGVSKASPNNRIGLNMVFESVNGQPCMGDISTH